MANWARFSAAWPAIKMSLFVAVSVLFGPMVTPLPTGSAVEAEVQ